jgi:hypothetical protein
MEQTGPVGVRGMLLGGLGPSSVAVNGSMHAMAQVHKHWLGPSEIRATPIFIIEMSSNRYFEEFKI